jgi:CheY-like chemotaxis protein
MNLGTGTGLGLAISAQQARLMGGALTVSSEAGTGTVCLFEIPVQPVDAASAIRVTSQRTVIGLLPGSQIPRVLIVDDEPDNRGWLNGLLTAIGFEVREADNGEAAIREWETWRPQLILMDLRMPVMGGLEATRRIRSRSPADATVIIALTASAMEDDRPVVMQAGVDELILKPCREAELLETIRSRLGLAYVFADQSTRQDVDAIDDGVSSLTLDALDTLPVEWALDMRRAIFNGDKDLVNELITRVSPRDAPFARALQRMADRYDYDALTQLLGRASP